MMQSESALVRTTPWIGVFRVPSTGANSASRRSCCRRSGEALTSSQEEEWSETANCACVRACDFSSPRRRRLQFEHAQFHWGKPPPAAEPRTLTRIQHLQFGVRVRTDLAIEVNFFVLRSNPFHGLPPGKYECDRLSNPCVV